MGDCDGSPTTGCEANFNGVIDCGRCGNDCTGRPYVASETCNGGECTIYSCEGGRVDIDGIFNNGCEQAATIGSGGAYGKCSAVNAGSVCGVGERCGKPAASTILITVAFNTCPDAATDCHCGFPCSAAGDCPAAPSGTAVPACSSYCYLSCSASGSTCPMGMHCATIGSIFTNKVCLSD
jgi:hypothetical protein